MNVIKGMGGGGLGVVITKHKYIKAQCRDMSN